MSTTQQLPTAPGTVIEATVYGQRVRLMRLDTTDGDPEEPWQSHQAVYDSDGYLMGWSFGDDETSDWTVLLAGVES